MSATQLALTEADTTYHLRYLAAAMFAGSPALFADYICWNVSLFRAKNMPLEWLTGSIADLGVAIGEVCGDSVATATAPFIEVVADTELDECPALNTPIIDPMAPHGPLAVRYLGALLGQQKSEAAQIVMQAVEDLVPIADIYLHIMQPALREIGRLWQSNVITVAQEHYATSVTQMIMSRLYDHIFLTPKNGRRLVAACASGELHEIGARMVADMFELAGWDTYYVGANTPTEALVDAIASFRADVVALSATMAFHIRDVAATIRAIRQDERTSKVLIVVGGYPFNITPELWREVGADGHGIDAASAIATAETLLASSEARAL